MLVWSSKLPENVAKYLPLDLFTGYGQYPQYLEQGRIYTLKLDHCGWGFYLNKFRNFLNECLSDIAKVLSISETGLFYWKSDYITFAPIESISLSEFLKRLNLCIDKFAEPWYILRPPCEFVSIASGGLVEIKQKEKEEEEKTGKLSFFDKIGIISFLAILSSVAIKSLLEKGK